MVQDANTVAYRCMVGLKVMLCLSVSSPHPSHLSTTICLPHYSSLAQTCPSVFFNQRSIDELRDIFSLIVLRNKYEEQQRIETQQRCCRLDNRYATD